MLMPFEWAVLTVEEASELSAFIEKMTATPTQPINFKKMQDLGIYDMYNKLRHLVDQAAHYQRNLESLNPDDFASYDHYHQECPGYDKHRC